MKQCWTKGLTEDKATAVRADFKGCFPTRKRLSEILESKIAEARRISLSKEGYSSPNWAYVQADTVGYERALNDVISIILDESVEK